MICWRNFSCLLCVLAFAVAGWSNPTPTEPPRLVVSVYNDAYLSEKLLAHAEQSAGEVFQRAGVAVFWINCRVEQGSLNPGECNSLSGPVHVTVRVRPHGANSTDAAFGQAFLAADGTGRYSDVFYDRIEKLCRTTQVSQSSLLGLVIAHEIGHLLLGLHAHASLGIMALYWEASELREGSMGRLLFTPDQVRMLRTRIRVLGQVEGSW